MPLDHLMDAHDPPGPRMPSVGDLDHRQRRRYRGCSVVELYFLSLPLRSIPVGIVYAVWSGLGIVLIAAVGAIWFRQPLDLPAMVGLGLILAGVAVVNCLEDGRPLTSCPAARRPWRARSPASALGRAHGSNGGR